MASLDDLVSKIVSTTSSTPTTKQPSTPQTTQKQIQQTTQKTVQPSVGTSQKQIQQTNDVVNEFDVFYLWINDVVDKTDKNKFVISLPVKLKQLVDVSKINYYVSDFEYDGKWFIVVSKQ